MANEFSNFRASLEMPASRAESVSPSDTVSLTRDSRALYVGSGGDISLLTTGGDSVTLKAVPTGSIISIMTRRVNLTGTTASSIVSLS